MKHLLEAGADVGFKTNVGVTALHVASAKGYCDIVELLIAAGADTEAVDIENKSPIDWAVEHDQGKVAVLLQKL